MTAKPASPEHSAPVMAEPPAALGAGGGPTWGAGAQAILSSIGETLYEWDVASDRLRWAANAAELLGVDPGALATGKAYDALVHPDSVTDRHQAVFNGIGVDDGAGLPFEITYALRLTSRAGPQAVWVSDRGVRFSDAQGRPRLVRGVVRVCRADEGARTGWSQRRELPRGSAFLRLLESVVPMAVHYRTPYAVAVLGIDNLEGIAFSHGIVAQEEIEAAVGERIRSCVRSEDIVGWVREGEIGLILGVVDRQEAGQAVGRIAAALAVEEIQTSVGPIGLTVSAGIAVVPADAVAADECLTKARRAQRSASAAGRPVTFVDEIASAQAGQEMTEAQRSRRRGRSGSAA